MQVTDAMVAAAMRAFRLQPADMNVPDPDGVYIDNRRMRDAIQAALDVMPKATGGYIPGPGPDSDSVVARLSGASCTYTLPPEMTRGGLPDNATVSINLGAADDKTIIETLARVLGSLEQRTVASPLASLGGHPLLDTSGFEDPMAMAMQHRIPVTEPRPLATVGELHHYLGESREFVFRAAAGMPEYDPPFPGPVREYGEDREPLYDPQAVKAWYDALPQAADE